MSHDEHRAYPIKSSGAGHPSAVSLTGIELDTYRVYRPGDNGGGGGGESQGGGFSVRDIFYALFRHKWKIATIFVVCSLVTTIYVSQSPDYYASEALVLVRSTRIEFGINPTARGESFLGDTRGGADVRSEIAIMQSRAVVERAVDDIGADKVIRRDEAQGGQGQADDREAKVPLIKQAARGVFNGINSTMAALNISSPKLGEREKAIQVLSKGLEIRQTMSNSDVVRVTYRALSPEQSQKVLQSYVAAYDDIHIKVHSSKLSPEFFKSESNRIQRELKVKEAELNKIQNELHISSIDTEIQSHLTIIGQLTTNIRQAEGLIKGLEAELSTRKATLSSTEKDVANGDIPPAVDPTMIDPQTRLNAFRAREIELKKRYTDQNRELKEVRENIKDLEELISGATSKGGTQARRTLNPIYVPLQQRYEEDRARLEGLRAQHKQDQENLKKEREDLNKLTQYQDQVGSLEREIASLRDGHQKFEQSATQAVFSTTLDEGKVGNIKLIQPASLPLVSDKSQRKMLAFLAFGVFAGLAAGIGLALALEFFDHSFKTSEEIEHKLGLPVLMTVPLMKGHRPEAQEETA